MKDMEVFSQKTSPWNPLWPKNTPIRDLLGHRSSTRRSGWPQPSQLKIAMNRTSLVLCKKNSELVVVHLSLLPKSQQTRNILPSTQYGRIRSIHTGPCTERLGRSSHYPLRPRRASRRMKGLAVIYRHFQVVRPKHLGQRPPTV